MYAPPPPQPGWASAPAQSMPHMATGPRWHFDIRRLATIDLVTGGATFVLLIALFLPWFSQPYGGGHTSGVGVHAYLFLVLLICVALLVYLVARAGWDTLPIRLPIAHAPLLLSAGVIDLLLVLLGFLVSGSYSHAFGSWLALLAAFGAALPIAIPAVQSLQRGTSAGTGSAGYPGASGYAAPASGGGVGVPPVSGGFAAAPVSGGFAGPPSGGVAIPASGAMMPAPGYQPPGVRRPVGQPTVSMGFGEAVRTVLSKYADFSGRARRAEYWWWMLAYWLGFFVFGMIFVFAGVFGLVLLGLYWIAGIVPFLAVTVRRLHDTDHSGAWYLICLVPFGGIVMLVFTITEGMPGPNQYGPPPKLIPGFAGGVPPQALGYGPGPGYPQPGYPAAAYPQPGYPPPGYPPPGYPASSYPPNAGT